MTKSKTPGPAENAPAPGSENAGANLNSIAAEAAGDPLLANPEKPGGGLPDPQVITDYETEAAELWQMAYDGLTPVFPSFEKIYTPTARARLARSTGALMEKYELTLGDLLKNWAPEISFLIVAVPLIPPTIAAIKHDNAARRADETAEQVAGVQLDKGAQKPAEETPGAEGGLHTKL